MTEVEAPNSVRGGATGEAEVLSGLDVKTRCVVLFGYASAGV
jgi:hypothetical protein